MFIESYKKNKKKHYPWFKYYWKLKNLIPEKLDNVTWLIWIYDNDKIHVIRIW